MRPFACPTLAEVMAMPRREFYAFQRQLHADRALVASLEAPARPPADTTAEDALWWTTFKATHLQKRGVTHA